MDIAELKLEVEQHVDVKCAMADVFAGLLHEFGEKMCYPDGRSMNMKIEAQPGGRWYRDLGDGNGHLWGTIQSIKAPMLLEITGSLFMSYPVINHLECKLSEVDGGTRVTLRHRALGLIQEDHAAGVKEGWKGMLESLKKALES
ncbi:MAG: SRPBCC domain-containing protein [Candidatus Hydrogenedentes bacterium]|nr:SRPBCC domain-containing protein [Candidatus Hydrogenedentota bacterium]